MEDNKLDHLNILEPFDVYSLFELTSLSKNFSQGFKCETIGLIA